MKKCILSALFLYFHSKFILLKILVFPSVRKFVKIPRKFMQQFSYSKQKKKRTKNKKQITCQNVCINVIYELPFKCSKIKKSIGQGASYSIGLLQLSPSNLNNHLCNFLLILLHALSPTYFPSFYITLASYQMFICSQVK